ncbi:hypothetical protein K402DRAFT_396664 [Aulographum hederae CBS 113979]|uniref:Uncharacterized protein n=1 Tax=Aulographum hederae CBS 113979 TaxID=1176131 RepID=A0A6G1GR28_9PEZI|nr:hypothetical protein K402DRAFT_396664 [Aulographum hederae CBS 113979]
MPSQGTQTNTPSHGPSRPQSGIQNQDRPPAYTTIASDHQLHQPVDTELAASTERLRQFLEYNLLVSYGLGPCRLCETVAAHWFQIMRLPRRSSWKKLSPGQKSIAEAQCKNLYRPDDEYWGGI